MDRLQYLILLAGCLLITLPLEPWLGARVYRRPRRLVLALAPMLLIFVTWDLVGIAAGHWTYNARFVSGLGVGALPIEEIAFFLVIPLCGLLTYEAVGAVTGRLRRWLARRQDRERSA